jgi:hypothetical protein
MKHVFKVIFKIRTVKGGQSTFKSSTSRIYSDIFYRDWPWYLKIVQNIIDECHRNRKVETHGPLYPHDENDDLIDVGLTKIKGKTNTHVRVLRHAYLFLYFC